MDAVHAAQAYAEPEQRTAAASSEPELIVTASSVNLQQGEQVSMADFCSADGAGQEDIVYTSDDESIASVDAAGLLTAAGQGDAVVTAALGEKTAQIPVCVEGRAEQPGLRITPAWLQLAPGQTMTAQCTLTGGAAGPPVWTSDRPDIVIVDEAGNVAAVGSGAARISASADGFSDSIAVWVTDSAPYPPTGEMLPPRFQKRDGILTNDAAAETDQATILLTGDLMALSAQQNAARSGGTYDYSSSFAAVQPIFASADFVMGNLETCLSYSRPYTAQVKTTQGNPNCNAQATYLDALRTAGYDAFATANNHSGDTGIQGLYETIQMLDTYSFAHTGTFTRASEPHYILANINGIRAAFLSYTEILNTKHGDLAFPEAMVPDLLSRYSAENVQRDVAAARAAGAEYVIVYNHWGTENTHQVNEKQMAHAQEIADAGADFIAGSHPHCLQHAEILTAADGRQVPCIYSMGNFVSSMAKDINNDTVILQLDLSREDGSIALKSAGYIPCRVFPEYGGGRYVIVPCSPALNGGNSSSALRAARDRIAAVLEDEYLHEIVPPAA